MYVLYMCGARTHVRMGEGVCTLMNVHILFLCLREKDVGWLPFFTLVPKSMSLNLELH